MRVDLTGNHPQGGCLEVIDEHRIGTRRFDSPGSFDLFIDARQVSGIVDHLDATVLQRTFQREGNVRFRQIDVLRRDHIAPYAE